MVELRSAQLRGNEGIASGASIARFHIHRRSVEETAAVTQCASEFSGVRYAKINKD